MSVLFVEDFFMLVEGLERRCQQYMKAEGELVDECGRYFKLYRGMMAAIDSYKNSFMDVRIIYNTDEKVKRYNECQRTYLQLQHDKTVIEDRVKAMNVGRDELATHYSKLEKQLSNFTMSFACKYIDQIK